MPRLKQCPVDKHAWRPFRKGERCEVCKTIFPCPERGCGHGDCHELRGEKPPEWVVWNFPVGHPLRREE